MDAEKQKWYNAMIARGHTPIMCGYDPTQLDIFVCDEDYCNGPGCSTCGWSACWHCNREMIIPECEKK